MADKNFTEFPSVGVATLADIILAVQGGVNVQVTQGQVFDLMLENTVLNYAGNPNGFVAGQTYQLCVDTSTSQLYFCSSSGVAAIAVWSGVVEGLVNPIAGGTGVISPAIHTLPVAQGASAFNFLGPLLDGELLIGSTGLDPVPATITAGANIGVVNAAGSITVSASGAAAFAFNEVTGTSDTMLVDQGYIANNAGLVTLTLPATAAVGTRLSIVGSGAGGWLIAQNALQQIHIGNVSSTIGVGGSVASVQRYNSLELVCIVADTEWSALGAPQSAGLTIV